MRLVSVRAAGDPGRLEEIPALVFSFMRTAMGSRYVPSTGSE